MRLAPLASVTSLRFSQHRALYAALLLLLGFALLMGIAALKGAGYNGPAFPNRADTPNDSSNSPAQNSGYGDVGNVGRHP
jgi:hypothetical protein